MAESLAAVILAAGHGTRMKSSLPKMLHPVAGRPLLEHVLRAVRPLKPERTLVVVGHGAERVRERFAADDLEFVLQERQLGTGHALQTAAAALDGFQGDVLVLTGDAPLLTTATLEALLAGHRENEQGMTLLTYRVADPTGLGRIVRDEAGQLLRIVEEKDATPAELEIDEINPGFYVFDGHVTTLVGDLRNENTQGEYYLTDLPGLYQDAGMPVHSVVGRDETALLVGVNDRAQLARAERILRDRIRRRWLAEGVTMIAPELTFIDDTVEMGRDVVLEPGVVIRGRATLGDGVRVGAYSVLEDVDLAPREAVPPHTVRCAGGDGHD